MNRWRLRRQTASDFRRLKQLRKYLRYERQPDAKADYAYLIKRSQFDLLLHRRGLTSPFDYEYPRLDRMNKLAQQLYDKHLRPMELAR